MSERKLTPQQIEKLFTFCQKQGIRHFDLQLELVDHLAAAIEDLWKQKPNLPFYYALKRTFNNFGVDGFEKIKNAKETALEQKHTRLVWQFLKDYFKLPRILMTIAFTLMLFMLLQFTENNGLLIGTYTFLFLPFGLFYYFYLFPKYFEVKPISGKSFLLIDYLKKIQRQSLLFIMQSVQSLTIYSAFKSGITSIWGQLLAAFIMVFFTILIYANCFYGPRKIREHFVEQFPQFIKS